MANNAYGPFGTSAAHCGKVGTLVRAPNGAPTYSGTVANDVYWPHITPYADVMGYSIWGTQAGPLVHINGGHKTVRNVFSANAPNPGATNICRSGSASNNNPCSGVMQNPITDWDSNGKLMTHQCMSNLSSLHGDSGGPIYRPNVDGTVMAAGTVSVMPVAHPSWTCFSNQAVNAGEMNMFTVVG